MPQKANRTNNCHGRMGRVMVTRAQRRQVIGSVFTVGVGHICKYKDWDCFSLKGIKRDVLKPCTFFPSFQVMFVRYVERNYKPWHCSQQLGGRGACKRCLKPCRFCLFPNDVYETQLGITISH